MELGTFSISLAVKDLQASRKFYEKFGFTAFGGDQEKWLILKNGNHIIGLFQGMFERNILTFNPGWDSNAKVLSTFTDVRDLQRQLKARGVTLITEADEASTGPASFVAVDPDGNPILVDGHRLSSWLMAFRLRMPEAQLAAWASRYSVPGDEIVERVAPTARARGYLLRDEFLALCRWKTPRSQPRCAENRDDHVREVTRIALTTPIEDLKIRILLLLTGVSWPTASVILHFCDQGAYPILDARALWSVGLRKVPAYTFPLWWEYTCFLREVGDRTELSMRTIDRALWQYSKDRQR